MVKVCVNGLLMSKIGIGDESSILSAYGYVDDDDDILRAYRSLGIDPYYRIKCNKCDMLGDRYHLYRILEHMNDHDRASFKETPSLVLLASPSFLPLPLVSKLKSDLWNYKSSKS
jgi:hypothetical protein